MTRGIDCKEIARVACKREIYYPSELYYKADGEIRDKLIEKLMATTSENEGSRLLGCLAMVGDEKAQGVLYELKKNPRPWRKNCMSILMFMQKKPDGHLIVKMNISN